MKLLSIKQKVEEKAFVEKANRIMKFLESEDIRLCGVLTTKEDNENFIIGCEWFNKNQTFMIGLIEELKDNVKKAVVT